MGQVHIHLPIITNDCKILQLCGAISNKSLSLDISPLNLITSLILRCSLSSSVNGYLLTGIIFIILPKLKKNSWKSIIKLMIVKFIITLGWKIMVLSMFWRPINYLPLLCFQNSCTHPASCLTSYKKRLNYYYDINLSKNTSYTQEICLLFSF